MNTKAVCGSADDYLFHSPWRAPGYAPVIDSCGTAGGRMPGQGPGGYGAVYTNTTDSKIGDLGSKTLKVRDTGVVWKAGVHYEVAWTIQANHGGGYSYRLCPLNAADLDEECFNKHPVRRSHCSDLTPTFIEMPRCLLWKRVPGYTIPMVPMHLPPMAPRNLVEQIRALDAARRVPCMTWSV